MKTKDIEIEIQVEIEKPKPLLNFLKKSGELITENLQIDQYFVPKHRNFLARHPILEWLRLRDSEGKFSITYKNWHPDKNGKTKYCDEYETTLGNMASLKKIFKALNMKQIVEVRKNRQIWMYKNYEIAIDKVKGLRNFVEIEYKGGGKADPEKISSQMIKFLKDTGCGKIRENYQGYPYLLLFPKEATYEDL